VWEKKRLLIWGKTYPEFSKKYYETVCTGALDADTRRLLRIYPVQLRYMKEPFRLFDWIEANVERNLSDPRPESYRIQQDSIKVVGHIETKHDGWAERAQLVLSSANLFPSVPALLEAQAQHGTSLGLVKPRNVRFYAKRCAPEERAEWEAKREESRRQKELFVDADTMTKELHFIPVRYRARFLCADASCTTEHDMTILDWGVYVLSWKLFLEQGSPQADKGVIEKLTQVADESRADSYFFLGNMAAHPNSFMVVGLFCPPRGKKMASARQLGLFQT
jgi:hypothetical protein